MSMFSSSIFSSLGSKALSRTTSPLTSTTISRTTSLLSQSTTPQPITCTTNPLIHTQLRHATKKSGGSSNNGRTSQPKMLGIKRGNGSTINPGEIIIRQRGKQWHAGPNVGIGKDHTLYALTSGRVVFRYDLAQQRRVVAVTDGSGDEAPLVGFGSRSETKQKLADSIDAEKYLSLDGLGRYNYVLEVAGKLAEESEQKRQELLAKRLEGPRRGRFDLVDLTLV
ncbi:hypothetical protein HDU76_013856 [Blyttiomyces sp. JEL0837]|nr:hypothetical protein HDU76_013856 [Blyttiomyces sp. JEL0837]